MKKHSIKALYTFLLIAGITPIRAADIGDNNWLYVLYETAGDVTIAAIEELKTGGVSPIVIDGPIRGGEVGSLIYKSAQSALEKAAAAGKIVIKFGGKLVVATVKMVGSAAVLLVEAVAGVAIAHPFIAVAVGLVIAGSALYVAYRIITHAQCLVEKANCQQRNEDNFRQNRLCMDRCDEQKKGYDQLIKNLREKSGYCACDIEFQCTETCLEKGAEVCLNCEVGTIENVFFRHANSQA